MNLKRYQQKARDTLKDYLKESMRVGGKYAYMGITNQPYNADFFGEVPFVCMKIPTGGGKTLVGCNAVVEIMRTALQYKMERGIVMWFVPSEAIKTQTLKKFKDRTDGPISNQREAEDQRLITTGQVQYLAPLSFHT